MSARAPVGSGLPTARFRVACAVGGGLIVAASVAPFARVAGEDGRRVTATVTLVDSIRPATITVLAAGLTLVVAAVLMRGGAARWATVLACVAAAVTFWLASTVPGSFTDSPVYDP